MKQIHIVLLALLVLKLASIDASPENAKPTPSPLDGFWKNTVTAHFGYNAFWHLGAAGVTGLMVALPIDEKVHRSDKNFQGPITEGALIGGLVWHIGPAAFVYWTTESDNSRYAAGAVIQAVGITTVVTTLQKYATGRRGPEENDEQFEIRPFKRSNDPADFNFKIWQNFDFNEGRFFWPSGHTATAISTASALTAYYFDDPAVIWIATATYTATLWMGLTMIDGSHHWASDVVAGALIGHAIGWSVGRNFRQRFSGRQNAGLQPGFIWQPLLSGGMYGLRVSLIY